VNKMNLKQKVNDLYNKSKKGVVILELALSFGSEAYWQQMLSILQIRYNNMSISMNNRKNSSMIWTHISRMMG